MSNGNGNDRAPLTREKICEAALRAIDESGLEGVSMRALAASLGVKASSLYYHFQSKEDLLTGCADFLYQKLGRPPQDGRWDDLVKGTFVQLHDFVLSHPKAAPLLLRDLAHSPVAEKRAKVLLGIMDSAGLEPAAGACLMSNLVALLVGHSLLSLWGGAGEGTSGPDGDGSGPEGARGWIAQVLQADRERCGCVVGSTRPLERLSPAPLPSEDEDRADTASFVSGLEALIAAHVPR